MMINRGRREYDSIKSELRKINEIPLDMAMAEALALLDRGEPFVVVKNTNSNQKDFLLPPAIVELANKFSTITMIKPPFVNIDFNEIKHSNWNKDFLVIGKGMESSDVEYELCVLPEGNEVYEIAQDGQIDVDFGRYASVYHWVVAVDSEQRSRSKEYKE
jgi:hypothetical protein